jgi:hypothetical protein
MSTECGGVVEPRGGGVSFDCCRPSHVPVGLWLPVVDRMENAIESDDIMADCIEQILLVDLKTSMR